jgi:hypothetical protein
MRGQAFEVFRLLIAAVVAGAILMVLLGLIQNLVTPTTDPQTAAAQLVKKFSRYGGTGSTDLIDFRKGMAIDAKAIAREAYLDPECVKVSVAQELSGFNCSDNVCEYDNTVGTKARIKVKCDEGIPKNDCEIGCEITIER